MTSGVSARDSALGTSHPEGGVPVNRGGTMRNGKSRNGTKPEPNAQVAAEPAAEDPIGPEHTNLPARLTAADRRRSPAARSAATRRAS